MKRLLVTGASGDLGRPLSHLAATKPEWEVFGTYLSRPLIGGGKAIRVDLSRYEDTLDLIHSIKPDAIIHAATSDRSPDMERSIRLAAEHVGRAAASVGCRLIALSTDMIFDGRQPPYPETARPSPLSAYGRVKAEVEQRVMQLADNCLIVRTSLIYDFAASNRQVSWMMSRIAAGERVPLFTDEFRQPIWAWNLSEILLELAEGKVVGILNVAGPDTLSRWEYGCKLLIALGYAPDQVAYPVRAAEVAPGRPGNVALALDKARQVLKTPLLSLNEAVAQATCADHGQASSTTTRR